MNLMQTVKAELERRGMTQREAAQVFGVSEYMLSRHLNGVTSPGIDAVNVYLHKLGIGLKMPELTHLNKSPGAGVKRSNGVSGVSR